MDPQEQELSSKIKKICDKYGLMFSLGRLEDGTFLVELSGTTDWDVLREASVVLNTLEGVSWVTLQLPKGAPA